MTANNSHTNPMIKLRTEYQRKRFFSENEEEKKWKQNKNEMKTRVDLIAHISNNLSSLKVSIAYTLSLFLNARPIESTLKIVCV